MKHDTPACTVILLGAMLMNVVAPIKNTFLGGKCFNLKMI
jgi:hypothetical protein